MRSLDRPNILLTVVDSLRSDHLSCYGYARRTTPFLDDISTRSVVFENAISASGWTRPSFSSIFTGTYPSKNGHGLEPGKFQTIMQVLRRCGYKTFGITDNHYVEPLCIGFDYFFFISISSLSAIAKMLCSKELKEVLKFLHYIAIHKRSTILKAKPFAPLIGLPADFLKNKIAEKWLSTNPDKGPFFVFLDYSAHWPYDPPQPFFSRFLEGISSKEVGSVKLLDDDGLIARYDYRDVSERQIEILRSLYDGKVSYVDSCLEDLIEHLESLDMFNNLLLVVTSDHGDFLGEHGLFGHEFSLYEPLIKVPLILRFPDVYRGGKRYSGLVQTLDILPTLIDYLNIELPDVSREIQGISLLKLMEGKEGREFTVSERGLEDWSETKKAKIAHLKTKYPGFDWEKYAHEITALRTEKYKYLWYSKGRHELYDLEKDPQEKSNLISIEDEKACELESKLDGWRSSFVHAAPAVGRRDLEASVKRRLRALGYLE